jgi:hypothetical protein
MKYDTVRLIKVQDVNILLMSLQIHELGAGDALAT